MSNGSENTPERCVHAADGPDWAGLWELPTPKPDYGELSPEQETARAERFDRWLAARDREVAARAIEAYRDLTERSTKAHAYAMDEDDWGEQRRLTAALTNYAAALRSGTQGSRNGAALSDFGADAQTAAERRILSEKWEREHPGEDSSKSRLPHTPERGK